MSMYKAIFKGPHYLGELSGFIFDFGKIIVIKYSGGFNFLGPHITCEAYEAVIEVDNVTGRPRLKHETSYKSLGGDTRINFEPSALRLLRHYPIKKEKCNQLPDELAEKIREAFN